MCNVSSILINNDHLNHYFYIIKIVTSDQCNILLIRAILAYKTEQVVTQKKKLLGFGFEGWSEVGMII